MRIHRHVSACVPASIYKEDSFNKFLAYTFTFPFYPYTNILFYYLRNI